MAELDAHVPWMLRSCSLAPGETAGWSYPLTRRIQILQQDQQASLDFAYAAVGRVAEVAKRITAQYYGKPADRSYFVGCSTGGREAMLMAQRYPMYFDGIVAGAPGDAYEFFGDWRPMGRGHVE
jgi:alpha-beta hydrolase superfamily lysophospholipase